MAKTLASLNIRVGLNSSQFQKSMKKVEWKLKRFSRNIGSIGKSINRNFTLPMGLAAIASGKLFTEVSTNFTKIENLVGITGDQLDNFKNSLRGISQTVGVAQGELSDALFVVTSAGLRGAKALEVLESAGKASAVGLGETKEIARATTAVLQAYGTANITAAEANEVLFKTVREGNLEASELAPALGRVIGIASQLNVSFADLGANVATFTRLGVNSEEAITGLRGVLSTFLKPTKQVSEALAGVGLTAQDVRDSFGEKGLARTLVMLKKRFGDNTEALGQVIPNIRALGNFLAVTGNQADEYLRISDSLSGSTDELGKAFEKMANDPAFQFKIAMVNLKNAAIDLGAIVVPVAVRIAKKISQIAKAFQELTPEQKNNIVKTAAWVAGIGVALTVISKLAIGIGVVIKAVRLLSLVIIENPIGALITGLTLAALWFYKTYKSSLAFRAAISGIGSVLSEFWEMTKETFGGVTDHFKHLIAAMLDVMKFDFKGAKENLAKAFFPEPKDARNVGERMAEAYADGYKSRLDSEKIGEFVGVNKKDIDSATTKGNIPPISPIGSAPIGSTPLGSKGITDFQSNYTKALELISDKNKAFGDSFNPIVEKLNLVKRTMSELLENGLGQGAFFEDLKANFETLTNRVSAAGEELKKLPHATEAWGETVPKIKAISMATEDTQGTFEIMGATVASSLHSLALSSDASFKSIGKSALGAAASVVKAKMLEGIAGVVARELSTKGIIGLLTGAVAAAGASALFSKVLGSISVPTFAHGNSMITGPTLAMVGEYAGASSNPEFIQRGDQIQDHMSKVLRQQGGQRISGVLRADGGDLVAIIESRIEDNLRTRGF